MRELILMCRRFLSPPNLGNAPVTNARNLKYPIGAAAHPAFLFRYDGSKDVASQRGGGLKSGSQ
jgi:hypothetical protein